MQQFFREFKKNIILSSLLSILLGVLLLIFPNTSGLVIVYALGAVLVLLGVINVLRYLLVREGEYLVRTDLVIGLTLTAVGMFVLIRADFVVTAVPVLFGLFILLRSFFAIQNAFDLRRLGYRRWWIALLLALLTLALGVVMLCDPFAALVTTLTVMGVALVYDGVSSLWTLYCLRRIRKQVEKGEPVVVQAESEDVGSDEDR